jgi:Cu+-exporting ATPase
MGTGTDVAMNSAQVTLVKGDLRAASPPHAHLRLATVRNMHQNLVFAFAAPRSTTQRVVPIAPGCSIPFGLWFCPR